jgi:hypothetical protein
LARVELVVLQERQQIKVDKVAMVELLHLVL